MATRRGRREKSKERRTYEGKGFGCFTGPQQFKDSPAFKLAEKAKANSDNAFHRMITVQEGPGYDITTFLKSKEVFRLRQATTKTEDALSDCLSIDVENDVKFKIFWEVEEIDKYYYSVPERGREENGQAIWVLYKILKTDVDRGSYKESARYGQWGGSEWRNIGCLNHIKFGGRDFRIYDFPYTVPDLEEPVEFMGEEGEDVTWKNMIRQRYTEGETREQRLDAWDQQMREEADALYKEIMDGKENKKPIELRYIPHFKLGEEVTKDQFKDIYESEMLSEYYRNEQKRWLKFVYMGGMMPGNNIKHVELKSNTQQVIDMLKNSYEVVSKACKDLKEGVPGCIMQGGRRKRTRRRRKKNRKKRTKKKARKKRRRKSSKRRRRRKR